MGQLSLTHLLIFAVILIVFFGPNKLPQLGQSLGKAIKGFKQGLNEIDTDSKDVTPPTQQQINSNMNYAQNQTPNVNTHNQNFNTNPNAHINTPNNTNHPS